MSLPAWVAGDAVANLQGVVAELESIFAANAIDPALAMAFILPVATGPSVSPTTPAPLSPITGLYAGLVALYNAIPMLVSDAAGVDPSVGQGLIALAEGLTAAMDPSAAAAAFAAAIDGLPDPAPPPAIATPNRLADSANAALIARFARMVFLAAYVEALVTATWPTRQLAITARADCVARFERELALCGGASDIGVATAMLAMRDRAIAYLSQAIIDAKPVITVTAAAELPVLVLAWRLYQSLDQAADLIARNAVPVAEFVAPSFEALAP